MAPFRIVLIGPESTAKTSLAQELARALDAPWTPEAARLFAESHDEPLSALTVEPIARLSMELEDRAVAELEHQEGAASARRLLIRDTDLLSTVVYARHYYGAVAPWIVTEARARLGDLYLLCLPDLPWRADGVRDRPMARDQLLAEFRGVLAEFGATVAVIGGAGRDRFIAAFAAVAARRRGA